MATGESRDNYALQSISSDYELQTYLETRARQGTVLEGYDPALVYKMMRNFKVEPLEPSVAVFLIELLDVDAKAQTPDNYSVVCLCPLEEEQLQFVGEKLNDWGYGISHLSPADVPSALIPVVKLTAVPSPCIHEQLRMLSVVSPDPAALLDGWVRVVQNRHRRPENQISLREWAAMRGVKPETVQANTARLGNALREIGGIPGTQWEMQESGGVSLDGAFS